MISQGAVGSDVVVLLSPALGQDLGFLERIEDLAVQQFISHLAVEGLDVAVLPGTTWLDKQRLHTQLAQPFPQPAGYELRACASAADSPIRTYAA